MIMGLPKKVVFTKVISAKGLSTFDGTHFDPDSQRILGNCYAEKMLKSAIGLFFRFICKAGHIKIVKR